MPRNYDTTGKLIGNTPEALANTTPANRVGGLLPGTAQPTGTKFMAYGESGTSDAFNRAFAAVSAQNDIHQMVNSYANIVPCALDSTVIPALNMSGAGTASIDIDTLSATVGLMYAYIGPVLDTAVLGMPFSVSHSPLHPTRAGARVRQVLSAANNINYEATPMYSAPSTISAALTQPTQVARLAFLGTSPAAGATYGRDYIDGVVFASYNVLPGAWVHIDADPNRGWYQITSIDGTGRIATIMKLAAKVIPVDTFAPAPWAAGPYLGHQFTDAAGRSFYVYDFYRDAGTGEGYLYVFPFVGPNWTAGSVNDIYALSDNDVLTCATAPNETCQVDFTARTIEDVGEPLYLTTGAAAGNFDFYCPPGFVPIGTSGAHTCTLNYGAALDGGTANDLYTLNIGIHAPTEEIYSSLHASGLALKAPASEHLNNRATLAEISQRGTNGDLKVRVTDHETDLWSEPQVAVYDSAGNIQSWISGTGGLLYSGPSAATVDEDVAPFTTYRSAARSAQRNIVMGQMMAEAGHTGRLLSNPGFSPTVGGAAQELAWTNTIWLATAGEVRSFAPNDTGPAGPWAATTLYHIYYDSSANDIAATSDPTTIAFSTFPSTAGAEYPAAADVYLGWFFTDAVGPNIVDAGPTRLANNSDYALSITVGSAEADFVGIEEAVKFIAAVEEYYADWVVAGGSEADTNDVRFKYEILLVADVYIADIAIGVDYVDHLVIDGNGHTLHWTPLNPNLSAFLIGDSSMGLGLGTVGMGFIHIKNLTVLCDWTTAVGRYLFDIGTAARVTRLRLENIVVDVAGDEPRFFLSAGGVAAVELWRLEVINCKSLVRESAISIGTGATAVNMGEWLIEDCSFTAGAVSATYMIDIQADESLTKDRAERRISGCSLICTDAANILDGGINLAITPAGSVAESRVIIENTVITDYAVEAILSDVPNTLVVGCTIDHLTSAVAAVDAVTFAPNALGSTIRDTLFYQHRSTSDSAVVLAAEGCSVFGCTFDYPAFSNGETAVSVTAKFAIVEGNHFRGFNTATSGAGVSVNNTDDVVVSNNTFETWDATGFGGIHVLGASCRRVVISGNTMFEDSTGPGVYVSATDAQYLTISGNSLYTSSLIPIDFTNATLASNVTIVGNTLGSTSSATVIWTSATTHKTSITGNTIFTAAGAVGGAAPSVVHILGTRTIVSGNVIEGNAAGGAATFDHLINLGAASADCNVIGNVLEVTGGGVDWVDDQGAGNLYVVANNTLI